MHNIPIFFPECSSFYHLKYEFCNSLGGNVDSQSTYLIELILTKGVLQPKQVFKIVL